MAEREGFEPPIALRLCLISSQVHSTGLCHLSVVAAENLFPPPWLRKRAPLRREVSLQVYPWRGFEANADRPVHPLHLTCKVEPRCRSRRPAVSVLVLA